jgi:cysteine-rich repeat protein
VVNPGEFCDAGGESPSCNADCSAVRCGDNIVNFTAGETCDSASLPTATCDTNCTTAFCGDGQLNPVAGELCDDGNSFFGDCCSTTCRPQTCESEPNNIVSSADSLPVNTTVFGRLTAGEFDYYVITVPANSGVRIVTGGATLEACTNATDTVIRLLNSASGELARDDDDADTGLCSLINPERDPGAYNLPAGTYYIEVKGFNSTATYDYSLRWSIAQSCGNAIIEPGETCDGGPTCGTNCQRLAVCGNGFIDSGESCDDANLTPGDGCGATCALENIEAEREGFNDNFLVSSLQSPYIVEPLLVVIGSLNTTTDVDYIPLIIEAEGVYRFEIANNINGSCVSPVSTPNLSLRDATDTELVVSAGGGPDRCAGITVWLPVGTYYLRYGVSSSVVTFYRFTAERITARGAETEPNELTTTATTFALPGVMTGFRGPAADIDYYRIQLTRPSSLFAEVIEGDASYNCSANAIDPRIQVLDATGTEIGVDDDGGRGFCSSANGIGASPDELGLRLLQPGTYYIAVTNSTFSDPGTPLGDFSYRLVAFTRAPY